MSILQKINSPLFDYGHYKLYVRTDYNQTSITMFLQTPFYHTKSVPNTHEILNNILPQVLKNKCFNDSNLPFKEEVKNTEIGHLFEHIILEYLCQIKVRNGYRKASFSGLTEWDWKKDLKGTYHIKIKIDPTDLIFFNKALNESVILLNKILISAYSKQITIN